MNRAFISLYLVIVVSLVLVGWGTDKLWQVYHPEPEVGVFEERFISLLEERWLGVEQAIAEQEVRQLSQELHMDMSVIALEELAQSALGNKINQGEIVTVFDDDGKKSTYKRINKSSYFLRIKLHDSSAVHGALYIALLILFYLVIAVIIYFWVWPLSRDLRKLQNSTQQMVESGAPGKVDLGSRSAVFGLAEAYNKMTDRIHELLASHKEMTYAVSHELRTPLARMKFAIEMAKDSHDEDFVSRQIDSVREDVTEMDSLINELLAYAGFEQRNQSLEFKNGDLYALTKNIVRVNQVNESLEIEIVNRIEHKQVYCEWYLMERCLHNVIQNAVKYARRRILITLYIKDQHYCVDVEDDGPGISSEDVGKVFQAFVRLRKESDENKSGFGLGLAIVHRIMKWHAGGVMIKRAGLGGARFILYWPIKLPV